MRPDNQPRVTVLSIQFELCHDSQLLSQYYDLRERCFRQELDLPGFDGREEDRDRQGSIVVARSGQRAGEVTTVLRERRSIAPGVLP